MPVNIAPEEVAGTQLSLDTTGQFTVFKIEKMISGNAAYRIGKPAVYVYWQSMANNTQNPLWFRRVAQYAYQLASTQDSQTAFNTPLPSGVSLSEFYTAAYYLIQLGEIGLHELCFCDNNIDNPIVWSPYSTHTEDKASNIKANGRQRVIGRYPYMNDNIARMYSMGFIAGDPIHMCAVDQLQTVYNLYTSNSFTQGEGLISYAVGVGQPAIGTFGYGINDKVNRHPILMQFLRVLYSMGLAATLKLWHSKSVMKTSGGITAITNMALYDINNNAVFFHLPPNSTQFQGLNTSAFITNTDMFGVSSTYKQQPDKRIDLLWFIKCMLRIVGRANVMKIRNFSTDWGLSTGGNNGVIIKTAIKPQYNLKRVIGLNTFVLITGEMLTKRIYGETFANTVAQQGILLNSSGGSITLQQTDPRFLPGHRFFEGVAAEPQATLTHEPVYLNVDLRNQANVDALNNYWYNAIGEEMPTLPQYRRFKQSVFQRYGSIFKFVFQIGNINLNIAYLSYDIGSALPQNTNFYAPPNGLVVLCNWLHNEECGFKYLSIANTRFRRGDNVYCEPLVPADFNDLSYAVDYGTPFAESTLFKGYHKTTFYDTQGNPTNAITQYSGIPNGYSVSPYHSNEQYNYQYRYIGFNFGYNNIACNGIQFVYNSDFIEPAAITEPEPDPPVCQFLFKRKFVGHGDVTPNFVAHTCDALNIKTRFGYLKQSVPIGSYFVGYSFKYGYSWLPLTIWVTSNTLGVDVSGMPMSIVNVGGFNAVMNHLSGPWLIHIKKNWPSHLVAEKNGGHPLGTLNPPVVGQSEYYD